MGTFVTALILFVPPIVLIIAIIAFVRNRLNWRYDDRNPARRWCRHCGQQQNFFVMAYAEGDVPVGWENVYPISKLPCSMKHE